MSEQVWWYATRASGLMSLSTAWSSVLIGVVLAVNAKKGHGAPWVGELHRFLSGITLVFLGGHLVALWLEPSLPFSWAELIAPVTSDWDVVATTIGVIAAWTLVAVEVTSILRAKISNRVWQLTHGLSVVAVGAGTYHAFLGGTDVTHPTTWLLAGAGSGLIVAFIYVRIQRVEEESPTGPTATERESLLIEMRQRLEGLPASTSALSLEMSLDDAPELPRRGVEAPPPAPLPGSVAPETAPPIAVDPFDAVAPMGEAPDLGEWVPTPGSDPFATRQVDPFRNNSSPVDSDQSLGGHAVTDPFSRPRPFTETPPGNIELFGPATEAEEAASDFPELPSLEEGINPFKPVEPTATVISISSALAAGPPPLPETTDGSEAPDEAAYTAWLVEWLAYAERYGDEAPGDPNRV